MSGGVQSVDWALLTPVLGPAVALLVVLVVQAVTPDRRRLLDSLTLAGILAGGLGVALLAGGGGRSTFCVDDAAGDLPPACSYAGGGLTTALQAVVLAAAGVCLLLALDGPGARARTEHHVLLLSATAGALTLAGARDLATVVIAVETASLPVVALVALRRDGTGAQAAIKLLLVSVVSLGLLLMGVALIYAGTGSVHLQRIATGTAEHGELVAVGAAFAIAGLAYKVSAVPFGWWTPDVYAGAPVPIAAFLSTVSKAAGLAGVVVVLAVGMPSLTSAWGPLVGLLAAASMTIGNLVALRQRLAVRLLAWSTIAQAGWVLLPLAGAGVGVAAAAQAAVGYLVAYVVATLTAFTVVLLVARHHPAGAAHSLQDYRGLARREPVAAAALAFALVCLAGLPPGMMGLVAKIVALRPVVDDGGWLLASVAAVNVALGLTYYLRWGALMLTGTRPGASPAPTWSVRPAEGLALGVTAGACLALSVLPQLVAGPFDLGAMTAVATAGNVWP